MGSFAEELGLAIGADALTSITQDSSVLTGVMICGFVALVVVPAVLYDRRLKKQARARAKIVQEGAELQQTQEVTEAEQSVRWLAQQTPPIYRPNNYLAISIVVAAVLLSGSIVWGTYTLVRSIQCAGFLASELGSTAIVFGPQRDSAAGQSGRAALAAAGCT